MSAVLADAQLLTCYVRATANEHLTATYRAPSWSGRGRITVDGAQMPAMYLDSTDEVLTREGFERIDGWVFEGGREWTCTVVRRAGGRW